MYKHTVRDIVHMLNQNIESVVNYLLPNGKRKNNEWCVGSVHGESGDSLKVHLSGDKVGVWCDFANNEYRGDLLNLWCQCRNLSVQEAMLEAKQWLRISPPQFEPQRRLNYVKPDIKKSVALTLVSPVAQYLVNERKLSIDILNDYGIYAQGDKIVFPYIRNNELLLVKYLSLERVDGKKHMTVSPNCEPCLFGWQCVPKDARSIVLTEGELDAMSLHQYGLPFGVLSIPFGGGGGGKQSWVENEFDRLDIYDDIYLCFDSDATGHETTQDVIKRLGRHRCRIVRLPHNDANECLQKGVTLEEIKICFDLAQVLDPAELKSADSFVEQVIQELHPVDGCRPGYKLPWTWTHDKILLASDELSIWTGINGHGKSQVLGQVMLGCIQQGAKVCIASLELKPKRLLARLTRQAAGLRLPTEEYIRAIHKWYGEQLWLFDLVGTAKTERLIEVFQYARQRYSIDVFIIDSFMKCGVKEDDYNSQKEFVEKLCDFKNEHNCHVHLVVHPRKMEDENKRPGKLDVKGSGVVTDLADNCFCVWRNKVKEEGLRMVTVGSPAHSELRAKHDAILYCDKQRNGEWEGSAALWFDPDSLQYLEGHGHKPKQMVDWSNRMQSTTVSI